MGWVKLDDGFFNNRKVVGLSRDAKLLYVAGLCYAGSALTDGAVPSSALPILAAQTQVKAANRLAGELVAAGLWEPAEGGYMIHDYLSHNSSADHVRAKRDAARDRMQRLRSGETNANGSQDVRANISRSSRNVREPETETEVDTETETEKVAAEPPTQALAPSGVELPEHGPAQQIVKAYCVAVGIDRPVSYGKAAGQAKQLVTAGITADHVPEIVDWLRHQPWVKGGIDLGLIVSQADKWLASRNQKPVYAYNDHRSGKLVT